ncbi:unnamed protein product [Durusdinium trenchii]|uniref:Uncharacterized protein n=1 Tax=Durusdinium trenchii TaxID=1381693 RepID=A0ABP0LTB2_9DINO
MKASLLLFWYALVVLACGEMQIRREAGLAAPSLLAPQVFQDAASESSEQGEVDFHRAMNALAKAQMQTGKERSDANEARWQSLLQTESEAVRRLVAAAFK